MCRPGNAPNNDAPGKGINDECHVNAALPGGHIGEVCQPEQIWPCHAELPVHPIGGTWRLSSDRGPGFLATNDATQPHLAHQTCHSAAGDRNTLAAELSPHLAHTINPNVCLEDAADLGA